jgi:hypothetical protein
MLSLQNKYGFIFCSSRVSSEVQAFIRLVAWWPARIVGGSLVFSVAIQAVEMVNDGIPELEEAVCDCSKVPICITSLQEYCVTARFDKKPK